MQKHKNSAWKFTFKNQLAEIELYKNREINLYKKP